MDKAAIARLDHALEGAKPDRFSRLKTTEFTAAMGGLYGELDYLHPFAEGNSRTLRTFTRQLAREAGYALEWERFNAGEAGRDLLYIARDRSVNTLAKPHIRHEATMRRIIHSADRLEGNRDLTDLLKDAIRPSRAIAFERETEADALAAHPELAGAYAILRAVAKKVEADGLREEDRARVLAQTRLQIAILVERGDVPHVRRPEDPVRGVDKGFER